MKDTGRKPIQGHFTVLERGKTLGECCVHRTIDLQKPNGAQIEWKTEMTYFMTNQSQTLMIACTDGSRKPMSENTGFLLELQCGG